jgi:4-hydroxybenzoate polyprenyltransferase
MSQYLRLARPRQWTKNLLVFAGLIFTGLFAHSDATIVTLLLFAAFCLASSAGYVWNDVADVEADQLHPVKRMRPVAAGAVSKSAASIYAIGLLIAAYAVALVLDFSVLPLADSVYESARTSRLSLFESSYPMATICVSAYLINQFFYSMIARRVAILDVFVIAIGFLVRAIAGAIVLSVTISQWLFLCTLFLALFLGFAKRRNEFLIAAESRSSLGGYSRTLLDHLISITAASSVIAYSLYAIQSSTAQSHPLLALTIPFPVFGIFRYLQITFRDNDSGSPDMVLLRDPWIWGTVLAWGALSIFAMTQGGSR